jgi:putative methionine-R-sulfoxide reductase with GAF domain
MANAPNSLSLEEMIVHIVSRDAIKIFGSDMICLYLVKPGQENVMHKFSSRTSESTSIDLSTTKSIAGETLKTGKVSRVNSVNKSATYNDEIDGCTGVLTKRILSLPLFNTQHSLVIGCVQFLNKGKNFEVFTEADEVFGLIFAHQSSLLITSCVMYDALFFHSQLLRGLLEASTELYSILPDSNLPTSRPLTPADVILVLEKTAREILKSPAVKAFLVSDYLNMGPNGQLIMLDNSHYHNQTRKQGSHNMRTPNMMSISVSSGVAGHVVQTKKQYIIEPFKFDPYLNPSVDLDPLKYSMLTVPIVDLQGNVIGCLQLLVGNRSPRVKESDDPNDFRLLFPQAAEWLTHQLAPALRYILNYMDGPVLRPVSTPSRLARSSMDVAHRASFLSHSEEVVTQMLSVTDQFNKEENEFVSVPFRNSIRMRTDTRTSTNIINEELGFSGPGSTSPFLTETPPAPTAVKVVLPSEENTNQKEKGIKEPEEKRVEIVGIDPHIHELLQNQLIEKQSEFENLWERFSTLEKENSDLLSSKDKGTEIYKKRLSEMETNEFAKQEILKKDFANKIALLNDDIAKYKEVVDEMKTSRENLENNLQFQVEKRLEYESTINDLKQEIKKLDQSKSSALDKEKSFYGEEIKNFETTVASLRVENVTISKECALLKESTDKKDYELSLNYQNIESLQQTILQLQSQLSEKDKLQTILQEQIVRLAGQNITNINSVMEEVSKNNNSNNNNSSSNRPVSTKIESSTSFIPTTATHLSSSKGNNVDEHLVDTPNNKIASGSIEANTATDVINQVEDAGEWVEQRDMLGRVYYYHEKTGESSWEDPRVPKPVVISENPQPITKGDWLQQFDGDGNEYWLNQVTGESQWFLPNDENALEADEDEPMNMLQNNGPSIYDTNASQFSATAGDYTIEL